jgi:hypothetical protein
VNLMAGGALSPPPADRVISAGGVGLTRLELVTFPLSEGCSNRLSYRPIDHWMDTPSFGHPTAVRAFTSSSGTLTPEEWQESGRSGYPRSPRRNEALTWGVLVAAPDERSSRLQTTP